MKKDDLIRILSEVLSIEEIPMLSNLEELREIIRNSDLDEPVKDKMIDGIECLIKDTISHGKAIAKLIKETVK